VEAAQGVPVVSFGARHVHPLVAPYMDYAAIVGGCTTASTTLGAAMAGKDPSGTMPHAMIICFGDTVKAAVAFDKHVEAEVPRVVLVDTFLDEPQEALRVAEALGERLEAVRLDTPGERGGVTPELVKETRARLNQAGFSHVGLFVSGGVTPERIRQFLATGAPVDGFGVGSYISSSQPNDFTADLKEVEGKPIAKRGRIPGITDNPRLKRLI
jgi:nicotinate phosphoribosyltransferase